MRCYVTEYLGKNRARFECPKGHRWKAALVPKKRGLPLPGEGSLRWLAKWWSKPSGGVTMNCPVCNPARGK